MSIHSIFTDVRNTLDADRVILAKVDLEGNDKTFSIVFECLKSGIFSSASIVKDIPYRIIDLEFGTELDRVVVGNSSYHDPICCNHLRQLDCKVIINQLLHFNDIVWGIFSLHFMECPPFITDDYIELNTLNYIKKCKEDIIKDFINYEKKINYQGITFN